MGTSSTGFPSRAAICLNWDKGQGRVKLRTNTMYTMDSRE